MLPLVQLRIESSLVGFEIEISLWYPAAGLNLVKLLCEPDK